MTITKEQYDLEPRDETPEDLEDRENRAEIWRLQNQERLIEAWDEAQQGDFSEKADYFPLP